MTSTSVRLRARPAGYGHVRVDLLGSGGVPADARDPGTAAVILRNVVPRMSLDVTGLTTVSLEPTSEIVPAGTAYRATFWGAGRTPATLVFTVPVSATPVDATAYETEPPGTLPSGPLVAETAARIAADTAEAAARAAADTAEAAARSAAIAALSGTYVPLPSGTPTAGQVPVVTTPSPLALGWGAGSSPSTPVVVQFGGVPGTVANTTSDHGMFWPTGLDLGPFSWEFWSCHLDETVTGYLISEGYGGAHAVLFGNVGSPTGNVYNGSANTSFGGGYVTQIGEWVHSRCGWDGTFIYVWINGVVVSMVPFAGPRRAQQGGLYIGGSDHSTMTGKIAMARGYEGACPLFNNSGHLFAFTPERVFNPLPLSGRADTSIPQFVAHFLGTPGARIITDHSQGYGGAHHPGALYGSGNGVGPPAYSLPPPNWVADKTAPFGVTEPARTRTPPVPTAVPTGAKVWDSVGRADSLPAFTDQTSGGWVITTAGSTEGGSLGPLAWQNPVAPAAPWGVFDGGLVCFDPSGGHRFVETGAATMDVSVDRRNALGYSGAAPLVVGQTSDVALCVRMQDISNYLRVYAYHDPGSNFVRLAPITAGGEGAALGTWTLPNYTWTTLRVVANGTTITVYIDGVQIGQATGVTAYQTQTKAGLFLPGITAVRAKNFLVK